MPFCDDKNAKFREILDKLDKPYVFQPNKPGTPQKNRFVTNCTLITQHKFGFSHLFGWTTNVFFVNRNYFRLCVKLSIYVNRPLLTNFSMTESFL